MLNHCRYMFQLLVALLFGTRFDDYSSAYVEPNAYWDDPYDRIIVSGTKVSPVTFTAETLVPYSSM